MHDLLLSCPQALLAEERRCGRAREARHKLELERLRQQLREAQDSNGELRGQVQHLEAQRLSQSWGGAAATAAAGTAKAAEGPAGSGSRRGSAGGSSGVPAAHAAARNAAGRWGQAGNGLPAVRVERGSSSSGGSSSGSGSSGGGCPPQVLCADVQVCNHPKIDRQEAEAAARRRLLQHCGGPGEGSTATSRGGR